MSAPASPQPPSQTPTQSWWHKRQWRLIQTNLREIDMQDIRASQVVTDLQAFRANVLMINAAGIIASYPTRLPYHYQSPYLTGDNLLEIISACHAAGIRVIARCDFSKVRWPVYEQHPEWAYLGVDGQIVDYNGDVHVCVTSAYQQQHMLDIIEELFSTHPFDGIFFNFSGFYSHDYSGNDHGPCQCRNCRAQFHHFAGLELPRESNEKDTRWRAYEQFKSEVLRAHEEKVYQFISTRWPGVCIANHLRAGKGFIRQEANTALDRPLPVWQYSASENTRWAVSSYPDMVCSSTTVDFVDFPYRHVAVSPHQQALRLAQNLAGNGALDYYLIGRLDNHADRSGFAPIQELFVFHAEHETDYLNLRSQAQIALVKPDTGDQREYRGWYRVLTESHFLFDVFTLEAAAAQALDRYQALLLPNLERIGDALAARLDAFVSGGGNLVATGSAGLADEKGDPHLHPALTCLGIQAITATRTNTRSCYFQLVDKRLFPRLADTDLVYMDGTYHDARYAPEVEQHLRLIPPHHFGPPERCYYTQVTEHPGFTRRAFGKGQAIYIPWLPGALFYQQGHPNTADFLTDLLQHVAGIMPIGGNLPPLVEVTLFAREDGDHALLHLVNASGHFGNTFYAPVPLHAVEVSFPVPTQPAAVDAMRLDQSLDFTWEKGRLTIHLPRLDLFEAVRIRR